jgi:HK97 family phage portal protein
MASEQGWNLPEELRAVDVTWGPKVPVDIPNGYGQYGHWDNGMVWQQPRWVGGGVDNAMQLSAVFACLRLLSEAISTLPVGVFTRKDDVRLPAATPKYLKFEAPQQSRINYLSQVMLSLLTDGNAFVLTPRDPMGVPVDLLVLEPTIVEVCRDRRGVYFKIQEYEFDQRDIMHIPGMMLPGHLRGVSPIKAARSVIEGAQSAQDYGTSFQSNSAVPPAVIKVPGDPTDSNATERARRIGQLWNETHQGANNAGKVGVLLGGAELQTIAVSPEDAQWLDSKRFTVSEIARFYGVPPHLIADASNSTSWGSGLQEQNLAFGQFSLRTWIERIDDAHTRLLSTHGRRSAFFKLNLDALLRASLSDRYASYAVAIQNRWMYPNEARRLEDMPPIEGGDEFPDVTPGGAE